MARMADSGWLMMGVPNSPPKTPALVRVKVEPVVSSGMQLFGAGTESEVGESAGKIDEGALLGLADDGHDEAPLEGDGDAEMNVLVVLDGRADERGVDDGEAAQGFNRGCGDEGHVSEVEAVALLEGGFLALAEADNAGHVHFVDGVDVRAGADALDHALGDDGAHFGHGDEVA